MKAVIAIVGLFLCACTGNPPVPPTNLARPAAWVMQACEELPEIPANDGDPEVRRKYHSTERPAYVACAAKHRELVRYVDAVAPKK